MSSDGPLRMRGGFTLLEVLLAALILGLGLATILVSMQLSQKQLLGSTYLETAQEVMDFGEMAYPLSEVEEVDDLDVEEQRAEDLWEKFAGDVELSREQREKFRSYTWERERVNRNIRDDDLKRLGYLHAVRITVRWGNDHRGNHEEESYVTIWRDKKGAASAGGSTGTSTKGGGG